MRCVLVLGGPGENWTGFVPEPQPGDYIIACDGGYPAAVAHGLTPHLAVGDFDSYMGTIDPVTEVFTAPTHKDDTDAMLGARLGLEKGYRRFLMLGALGGRLDHTLGNLQVMTWLNRQGASCELQSGNNRVWMVENGVLKLPRRRGWHLSVFAWGGPCNVTLRGVEYPLTDYHMTPDFPIGVSNEFIADEAVITAREGMLLVAASKEPGAEE